MMRFQRSRFCQSTSTDLPCTRSERFCWERVPNGCLRSGASIPRRRMRSWVRSAVRQVRVSPSATPMTRHSSWAAMAGEKNNGITTHRHLTNRVREEEVYNTLSLASRELLSRKFLFELIDMIDQGIRVLNLSSS